MELSFAVQHCKDMVCGICMKVVYEKSNPSECCFGILSNCKHTYHLKCIQKWKNANQFESKIIKSYLECQITSNFAIPIEYWVEEKKREAETHSEIKAGNEHRGVQVF